MKKRVEIAWKRALFLFDIVVRHAKAAAISRPVPTAGLPPQSVTKNVLMKIAFVILLDAVSGLFIIASNSYLGQEACVS
jgi:hypothetical protein